MGKLSVLKSTEIAEKRRLERESNEELNEVYLVPVDQVGITAAVLRLKPRKNNLDKETLWAKDYEL